MEAKQEYIEIIKDFIRLTDNDKLEWKKQNPTTLYLEKVGHTGERAIVSIQKVQDRNVVVRTGNRIVKNEDYFVFSVKNMATNDLVVQIDSKNQGDFKDLLHHLFDVATYKIEKKSINFLRGLMD